MEANNGISRCEIGSLFILGAFSWPSHRSIQHKQCYHLGEKVGKVVAIQESVENWKLNRSFIRVRIMMDLSKPLVEGMWVPHPKSKMIWVGVKYERLQSHKQN